MISFSNRLKTAMIDVHYVRCARLSSKINFGTSLQLSGSICEIEITAPLLPVEK